MDTPIAPGLKRKDLTHCLGCGRGVMHDNQLAFYRLRLDHLIANVRAIERQHGLEMFIGSPAIAQVMGPDEDLARTASSVEGLVCLDCATHWPLTLFNERASARETAAADAIVPTPDPEAIA